MDEQTKQVMEQSKEAQTAKPDKLKYIFIGKEKIAFTSEETGERVEGIFKYNFVPVNDKSAIFDPVSFTTRIEIDGLVIGARFLLFTETKADTGKVKLLGALPVAA
jgi:hypothetical protein